MDLTAISSAAAIALASTIMLLLAIKSWALVVRLTTSTRFPDSIMLESAQRIRDKLVKLTHDQSVYLVSALLCTGVFCIFYLTPPQGMFDDVPQWQLIVVLLLLGIAAVFVAYRAAQAIIIKRKLLFHRDAIMATGHALQKLTGSENRVFYDVPCSAGIIDNVIVGSHGIYSVNVIARRAGKDNRASLNGEQLTFASKQAVSIKQYAAQSAQLAGEIRKKNR